MPYSTLVSGTTITSSWANANVRDQVVTPFATTAARDSAITSPVNGMLAVITDDDQFATYNGSAWVTCLDYGVWTPWTTTLTQSGTVTHTITYGQYKREGNHVTAICHLTVTGTGTASNVVTVSLPVTTTTSPVSTIIGAGRVFDLTGAISYTGAAQVNTSTTASIVGSGGVTNALGVAQFTAALASGDLVSLSISYEV